MAARGQCRSPTPKTIAISTPITLTRFVNVSCSMYCLVTRKRHSTVLCNSRNSYHLFVGYCLSVTARYDGVVVD